MSGFEALTSGVGSDCSVNIATTTAAKCFIILQFELLKVQI